jgi:PTH1 family peptidyl-tRNA hydrolase
VGKAKLEGVEVELVKPQTFMNLSGEAVACLLKKQGAEDQQGPVIVISDDLALPFGKIRIRARGSAGGHNGLKSIIEALKRDEFVRLRIGIQPEHPVSDTKRFVLDRFSKSERDQLDEVLARGSQAVRTVLRDGVAKAMSEFN